MSQGKIPNLEAVANRDRDELKKALPSALKALQEVQAGLQQFSVVLNATSAEGALPSANLQGQVFKAKKELDALEAQFKKLEDNRKRQRERLAQGE